MKLVIEVVNESAPVRPPDAYEQMRIGYLEAAGYNVLRFAEEDARDRSDMIVSAIRSCISVSNPTN